MINISKKEFDAISNLVRLNCGISLKYEQKKNLVISRLQNIVIQKKLNNFSEYYQYIKNDTSGEALITLIEKLTTNYSYFMREPDHFNYFTTVVLPYLISKNLANKDLRIWSAGCSTGEEPYTLAMLMSEFFGKEFDGWNTKILATDISYKVLDKAQKGIYSNEQLEKLPSIWKQKYFKKADDNWEINKNIRNEVIFRKLNLNSENFPFKKNFNVIFCRNVMIYFDQNTKDKLINKFYKNIEYGGYLFIGHSESINRDESKFKYIKPSIYRKE